MNKKKMKGIYCLLLAGLFLFSTFAPSFLSAVPVSAENVTQEESTGSSEAVTLTGNGFSISLDEVGNLTKEDIIIKAGAVVSNGSQVTVDDSSFNTLTKATAEGVYTITLTGGGQTLAINVDVVNLQAEEAPVVQSEEDGMVLQAIRTDGNVTIDMPDYVEADGFKVFSIYDAKITVNFGEATSENKTVKITLPEGMRFATYPVTGTAPNIGVYTTEDLYGRTHYFSKVTTYVYYPIGFKYISSNYNADYVEHNDSLGYVKFEYNNFSASGGWSKRYNITVQSESTLTAGTYTAARGCYSEVTNYDGTMTTTADYGKKCKLMWLILCLIN